MIDANDFFKVLIEGKVDTVKALIRESLTKGFSPEDILNDGLIKAMEPIGALFKNGQIFMPEVLVSAHAMHAGLSELKPLLAKSAEKKSTKVVLGTVKGDLHDIGKNLIGMMLEGGGFEVVDIGVNVAADTFVEAAKREGAKVVGLSALLTTTMVQMKETIVTLRKAGLDHVKVIVGGAPVTARFAKEIGADSYAADAGSVVEKVKEMLESV